MTSVTDSSGSRSMQRSWVVLSKKQVHIVGCASGIGGRYKGAEKGVTRMKASTILDKSHLRIKWESLIKEFNSDVNKLEAIPSLVKTSKELAEMVGKVLREGKELAVIGGDHSCAIGTWTGVANACAPRGPMGLIWVDAHMDAHTPTSSHSGNVHGMPVAHLLGHGDARLSDLFGISPKVRPQNLALVGIRSFESEERELLEKLKVPIFYDTDVQKRGLKAVMDDALVAVNDGTVNFGMSIDLDGFRPQDAPGTGTPEKGGIVAAEFLDYLSKMNYQRHIATEIVEFMPEKDDQNKKTEMLVAQLLETIYLTKFHSYK